jgi:hypothetical protein
VILGFRQLAGRRDPSCFFKMWDALTDMVLTPNNTAPGLMEGVWGEDEILESEHLSRTLANEGFRHGKQSEDDLSRQAGFNSGFGLGRKVGSLWEISHRAHCSGGR